MTTEEHVVFVIGPRFEIVVMSMGRRSEQVRERGVVLEGVRLQMRRLQMDAKPEHRNNRCQPSQEDGCRAQAPEGGGHAVESARGQASGSSEAADRSR